MSEWFGRTVIRSCVKLAYEHAQSMIDEPAKQDWEDGVLPNIDQPYNPDVISAKAGVVLYFRITWFYYQYFILKVYFFHVDSN